MVKNLPASAGDAGDVSSNPGLGRSQGVRKGNPLQYSCLEDSMNRGVRLAAAVCGVAELDRTEHACRQLFSPSKAPTSTSLSNLFALLN